MKNKVNPKNKIKQKINKKAFELNMFGWWVIGLAVLAISFLGYLILSGKLQGAVSYIKNIFRFGAG